MKQNQFGTWKLFNIQTFLLVKLVLWVHSLKDFFPFWVCLSTERKCVGGNIWVIWHVWNKSIKIYRWNWFYDKFNKELQPQCLIQPWNFAYIWVLNKPYENEVTLTEQNPRSKCCQHLETWHSLKKCLDLLMLKILGL